MKMFEKILERRLGKLIPVNSNLELAQGKVQQMQYLSYLSTNARKTPRSEQESVLYLRRLGKSIRQSAQGSDVLVSEKARGSRDGSKASRSNTPWSINNSENHAWQN